MIDDARKFIGRFTEVFVRWFYGPTFRCPVCHVMLATVDADGNRLLVCPVCGAVLEIEEVYGHVVPVVMEMEILRPQPKARLHPLATHLPIGLFPFALLGAVTLLGLSLARSLGVTSTITGLTKRAPVLADATLVLLVVSVGFALATLASGLWDWWFRYRRRSYRQITLKIVFAIVFLVLGAGAIALHASGLVFAAGSGLMATGSPLGLVVGLGYVFLLTLNMIVLATLGHVGGTLVFGR
jgi:uncharacterized C2H2 Zn-finger protein